MWVLCYYLLEWFGGWAYWLLAGLVDYCDIVVGGLLLFVLGVCLTICLRDVLMCLVGWVLGSLLGV